MSLTELFEKATPLPWKSSEDPMYIESTQGQRDYICRLDGSEGRQHHANSKLVVHAVNMLPKLERDLAAALMALSALHNDGPSTVVAHILTQGNAPLDEANNP